MKKILTIIFALGTIWVGASCKKENEPSLPQSIEGLYRITNRVFENPNGGSDIDGWADIDDCEKDNTFDFRAGGVLALDESSLKCDEDDPQQGTGSYVYDRGNRTLTLTINFGQVVGSLPLEVLEITATTIKAKAISSASSNPIITYTKI